MGQPQSGILSAARQHAIFLTQALAPGDAAAARLRAVAARIPALTEETAALDPEAGLCSVVAIGAEAWDRVFPDGRPDALTPFRSFEDGGRLAPATPADVLIHLRADRIDLCFELARRIVGAMGDAVREIEEVRGFRYLDARDLTGFVDGTENPEGEHRAEVALLADTAGPFAGGSYVDLQRYVHDLQAWEALSVAEQEQIIARTKADNVEFESDQKPPTAHIKVVSIKDPDGSSVEILRHSMPYGTTRVHGLVFIAYAGRPDSFERMLKRMIVADADGNYDHLMDYSRAVTGCSFFAPPRDWLEAQGQGS